MINYLLAIVVGLAIGLVSWLGGLPWYLALVIGLAFESGIFILLTRRTNRSVQTLLDAAFQELKVNTGGNAEQRKLATDKALSILQHALVFGNWYYGASAQVHAQIGLIHYQNGQFELARSHLAKSSRINIVAQAYLGAIFFREKRFDDMERVLEKELTTFGSKSPLVWALYAWCQLQRNEKSKALEILKRGIESNPTNPILKASLEKLQSSGKLDLSGFGAEWWSYGFENP